MARLLPLLAFVGLAAISAADRPITITIVHSNDMHDHVQSTPIRGVSYGGYARQATLIRQIRGREKNVLLLNAGDMFQGTLYFNVYQGLAEVAYLNEMGYDSMAVGNHEFDNGPTGLAKFVDLATFPVLSADLDVSAEPSLRGKIAPSTVLKVGGERVGVVGATTVDVTNISSPGPNVRVLDLKSSVQAAVDGLTKQGINKIVLLTHIGYAEDKALATQLHDVDIIVGGHSHTPLGTPDIDGWRKAEGPYPTLVKDAAGQTVPIVQAYEWSKVLGEIKLDFDGGGHIRRIVLAKPIIVDEKVPEDMAVKSLAAALEKPIMDLQNSKIGTTNGALSKESVNGESLMADVIADSMLEVTTDQGSVAAFVNSGGVRASLEQGTITYGQAISVQPFGNTLTVLELSGVELLGAINEGIGSGGELNPSHGTSYRVDRSKPKGEQAADVMVAGQPLDPAKTYRVTFLNFTANGGDAHKILQNAKGARVDTKIVDLDALIAYIKRHSPLDIRPEGRLGPK